MEFRSLEAKDQGQQGQQEDSSEESTVKLKQEGDITSMLTYLVNKVQSLEKQVKQQSVPEEKSEISSEGDDNVLVSAKWYEFIPIDRNRWSSTKASDQAQGNLTKILKSLDISGKEDNWAKFESYFQLLVDSLELSAFVFGDPQPAPITLSDLVYKLAGGNEREADSKVLPGLYKEGVQGRIFHVQFPGAEVINDAEKRRFDTANVLLFSILTACTSSQRLEGVMNREGATDSRNIGLMFRHLRNHFVQLTGTSMTQKVMRLISIARFDRTDKASVNAIEVIRESKRAFADQEVIFPEIFFVSIFLATLDPTSAVRDRLQLLVNEAGKGAELDSVIEVFHTWYRNQEIQQSNDSYTLVKSGKPPRDPKALLLTIEEQKFFKGCTKMGACYQCYKKNGHMMVLYKDCLEHNKKAKSGAPKKDTDSKVKSKLVKANQRELGKLLSEADEATKGISEEIDYVVDH